MRAAIVTLPLSAVFLLAACGAAPIERAVEDAIERDSGQQADVDIDNGAIRIATDDTTAEIGAGVAIPDGWPSDIAVYEGATVQYAATGTSGADGKGMTMSYTVNASAEDVVAFYKRQMTDGAWNVQATIALPGGTMITATKDTRSLGVQVGAGEQTSVVLIVGNQ